MYTLERAGRIDIGLMSCSLTGLPVLGIGDILASFHTSGKEFVFMKELIM